MDKMQLGYMVRGDQEYDRENFGKAYDAYKLAGDFPGVGRRIAGILSDAGKSIQEVSQVFIEAYEKGDVGSLPWVIDSLEKSGAPIESLEQYRRDQDRFLGEKHPELLGAISRTYLFAGDFETGLQYLAAAILAGDSQSKTNLAAMLINPEPDSKLIKKLQKKIFDLRNWPVEPDYELRTKKGYSQTAFEFIESLLTQGDDQPYYSANRYLFYLYATTHPEDWSLKHFQALVEDPSRYTDFWNDPEYLLTLSREVMSRDTSSDFTLIQNRMKDFGIEDLYVEILETDKAMLEAATHFGDFDQDELYVPSQEAPQLSPLISAHEYFPGSSQIDDLAKLLEVERFREYDDEVDSLVALALSGKSEAFERAGQIIELVARRAQNYGTFKKYSFHLQNQNIIKLFANTPKPEPGFLEFLSNSLVSKNISSLDGLFQEIFFAEGVPDKVMKSIARTYPESVEYWGAARTVNKISDEIFTGDLSNISEFGAALQTLYKFVEDPNPPASFDDDIWWSGVRETFEYVLENQGGLKNREIVDLIIEVGKLDPHISCQLLYVDRWSANDLQRAAVKKSEYAYVLTPKDLDSIFSNGECDEQYCLGMAGLIATHPNASSDLLSKIFAGRENLQSLEFAIWGLAHNRNTPPIILSQLARETSRAWGIEDEIPFLVLPLKEFGEDSRFVQSYTAWAVADNPAAPEEVLEYLRNLRADSPEWLSGHREPLTAADIVAAIKNRAKR